MSTNESQNTTITTPTAILNLASILNQDASIYEVREEGSLRPEKGLGSNDFRLKDGIGWRLIVRSTGGDDDFILEGNVSGDAFMDCRRCLDEVEVSAKTSFIYPMVYKQGVEGLTLAEDDSEEGDLLIFGNPEVDFTDFLSQLYTIELPLAALCKEDCKGLSSDGVNLNHNPEHEVIEVEEKASPFAVLKDIEL